MARKPVKPNKPAKQTTPALTPFYAVLGVIALAGVGLILYQLLTRGGSAATEPVEVEIDASELASVQGISIGEPNAPVVIYEFADFQCPACASYAALTAPLVKERLVESGLVRYVHYDFPLTQIHPHAFLAARAGRCAEEQGGFWQFHDLVYARQMRWSSMGDASGVFIDIAEEIGLDRGQFTECLRSDRFAEEVTRNMRLGESLGVPGTPTLFVNMRRLPQVPSYSELEALVRSEAGLTEGAGAAADTAGAGAAADTMAAAATDQGGI